MIRRVRAHPPDGSPHARSESLDFFALAAAQLSAQRRIRNARLRQIASRLQNNHIELVQRQLTEHLASCPDDADAISLKAQAAVRLGRHSEAASLLARCLELAPDFAAARFSYAKLLFRLNRFGAALSQVDRLLLGDSRNPLFRQLNANILGTIGDDKQSLAICAQLSAENPGRPESWVNYGHALRASGFQEQSIAAYRKAVECRPSFGSAWWSLADMKTFRFSDVDIGEMQTQVKRPNIGADDRIALQFALGKAHEDLHAYDRSWEQYVKANAGMRLRIDYDLDSMTSRVASNKALFTPEFLRNRRHAGCNAHDPIFIVGMNRAGSTLIEQILSSHSAIEGTAELPFIPALARRLGTREGPSYGTDYLEAFGKLEPAALADLGEEYLESTRAHRRLDRPFVIDKNPANFWHVGMINLILPNAKIIDARRHPVACCVSMFRQKFSKINLRLSELGRFYRAYVELMAHFDRMLPGRIHRVFYEDMVANPETEIRRLIRHLELPFEESCLRFYETGRTIRTPSSEQVRKPISGEAVDHWRNFEPWLGPLINSLGSVFSAYPSIPEELR
jgi:tetratricopeptide (TPR) repeat protein